MWISDLYVRACGPRGHGPVGPDDGVNNLVAEPAPAVGRSRIPWKGRSFRRATTPQVGHHGSWFVDAVKARTVLSLVGSQQRKGSLIPTTHRYFPTNHDETIG